MKDPGGKEASGGRKEERAVSSRMGNTQEFAYDEWRTSAQRISRLGGLSFWGATAKTPDMKRLFTIRARTRQRLPSLVLATILCLWAGVCAAQNVQLTNPSVNNVDGALTARFGVTLSSLDEVASELEAGVSMRLVCQARLYRENLFWFDALLSDAEYEFVLSYDALNKEYALQVPGMRTPVRHKNLAGLMDEQWSSLELTLGSWDALRRGHTYSLKLKAFLGRGQAPDSLAGGIFHWFWGKGASSTYMMDFRY